MELKSLAFSNANPIPLKYASPTIFGGQNISIPLIWSGAPAKTKSFVLTMVNRQKNNIHWFVLDIPKGVTVLAEGSSRTNKMPAGAKEVKNTFGNRGYDGPQPLSSVQHEYEITLYAMNAHNTIVNEDISISQFEKSIGEIGEISLVFASAKLIGTF